MHKNIFTDQISAEKQMSDEKAHFPTNHVLTVLDLRIVCMKVLSYRFPTYINRPGEEATRGFLNQCWMELKGGRSLFVIELKSFEILIELSKGKVFGKITEKGHSFS